MPPGVAPGECIVLLPIAVVNPRAFIITKDVFVC
jgi:hypothetical protein